MERYLRILICAGACIVCRAQTPDLTRIFNFEAEDALRLPAGWGITPGGVVQPDEQIVHSGRRSARIERAAGATAPLSGILASLPMTFAGERLEMRAFLRTEEVTGFVGMWAREDGESGQLAFDNMQSRNLNGTHDWAEYSIAIPVRAEARTLVFGVFVTGTGKAWVDDLQLLVDGKPIWEAPRREVPKTIVDEDHEFDGGSGIAIPTLTPIQIENLASLAKVWGFLKYHHPAVTGGKHHWDYDLFRVMPAVLAAPDRSKAGEVLRKWVEGLGPVGECKACVRLETADLYLRPDLKWMEDDAALGPDLREALRQIYDNRPAGGKQFYAALIPGVHNPEFPHELNYQRMKPDDGGMRLLAVFRFWNIIQYWYPNRDILGEDWGAVLRQSIARIGPAKSPEEYQREMMALIARVHDTHANLWSSLAVRPPVGACQLPLAIRFLENRAVVAGYTEEEAGQATGLKRGDVIVEMDGVPVTKLVKDWTPYYADSNEAVRLRDMGRAMTRGECGEATLQIRRESQTLSLKTNRIAPPANPAGLTHDLPGPTFRRLSDEVAYLKLSSIKASEVPGYIDRAAGTKGLIVDIRNYPSEFVVFALGQLLVDRETGFARFTQADLSNPGAFHWQGEAASLKPAQPHYAGKVVILVDEVSQSQAEYTTMAFRMAAGAKVIGSTTAGADGNVSAIPLPGGLQSMISGIGVFYPDKRPTQRIGIVPDVKSVPTVSGIRDGRDEVLEEAVRQIVGRAISVEEIRKMVKP